MISGSGSERDFPDETPRIDLRDEPLRNAMRSSILSADERFLDKLYYDRLRITAIGAALGFGVASVFNINPMAGVAAGAAGINCLAELVDLVELSTFRS